MERKTIIRIVLIVILIGLVIFFAAKLLKNFNEDIKPHTTTNLVANTSSEDISTTYVSTQSDESEIISIKSTTTTDVLDLSSIDIDPNDNINKRFKIENKSELEAMYNDTNDSMNLEEVKNFLASKGYPIEESDFPSSFVDVEIARKLGYTIAEYKRNTTNEKMSIGNNRLNKVRVPDIVINYKNYVEDFYPMFSYSTTDFYLAHYMDIESSIKDLGASRAFGSGGIDAGDLTAVLDGVTFVLSHINNGNLVRIDNDRESIMMRVNNTGFIGDLSYWKEVKKDIPKSFEKGNKENILNILQKIEKKGTYVSSLDTYNLTYTELYKQFMLKLLEDIEFLYTLKEVNIFEVDNSVYVMSGIFRYPKDEEECIFAVSIDGGNSFKYYTDSIDNNLPFNFYDPVYKILAKEKEFEQIDNIKKIYLERHGY